MAGVTKPNWNTHGEPLKQSHLVLGLLSSAPAAPSPAGLAHVLVKAGWVAVGSATPAASYRVSSASWVMELPPLAVTSNWQPTKGTMVPGGAGGGLITGATTPMGK